MAKAAVQRPIDWPFIYFAHVGKTGGTSMRHAAIKQFGEDRCICLYAEGRSGNTGGGIEVYQAEMAESGRPGKAARAVIKLIHEKRPAFFSTHSNGVFARFLPVENTVTFVRDPVERAISQYNFWKNLGRDVPSFEDYVETEEHQNLQSRTLRNIDLNEIAVVGVTDRLGEAIDLVNRRFGVALQTLRSNKTTWRPWKIKRGDLSPEMISRIEQLNADDMALYESGRMRFERDLADV